MGLGSGHMKHLKIEKKDGCNKKWQHHIEEGK